MTEQLTIRGVLGLTLAGALLTGCANLGRTTQTTSAPAGPIRTTTTEPGVIPAGTQLAIRTNQEISTKEPGKTYSAEIAQDIVNADDKVLVPKGSAVELAVVDQSSGGAVGTRTMDLAVRSVTVNGRKYPITSETVQQRGNEGIGANRRTAEVTGGGALLGTLIGAIAGGGKGAAIGAAVGAAGGAATQVLTRGDEIRVPAESVLTFRLDQPWKLQGMTS
jgi:hypothetical protein